MLIGVLLTAIIILTVSIWLMCCCLRVVRVRQALIICDRVTDNVRRVVIGPKKVMVWPLENILTLDLTTQTTRVTANDIVTSDLAVGVSLDIFHFLDPALLQAANLNQIMPFLTETDRIVQSWANYILRSLAAEFTTTALLTVPARRARMENLLRNTLQDRVKLLGVRIHAIRLLCSHPPMMLEAHFAAERTKLTAQARAQALEMLAAAVGSGNTMTDILPLELLQRVQQGDTMPVFNLSLPAASKVNELDPFALHWMLTSR